MRSRQDVLEALAGCWSEGGPDLRARPGKFYKGGSQSTTSTNINYSPEEAARRSQVMDEATRVYNQTAGTISSAGYPGPVPVGASADTTAAQQMTRNTAAQGAQGVAGATGFQNQANTQLGATQYAVGADNAWNSGINGLTAQAVQYGLNGAMDVQNNPYLQQAMQAAITPITQSYVDPGGVMSGIRTNAANAGQYGGSRQGIAEGVAAGRYAQAIGDATAKIGSDAYAKGQDIYSKTLGLLPQWQGANNSNIQANSGALTAATNAAQTNAQTVDQLQQTGLTGANAVSAVGAQNENLAQQWQDYLANQRSWELNSQWAPLQNYAGIVYGNGASGTSSTSSTSAPRAGVGQAVGAGLTAASLASQFL